MFRRVDLVEDFHAPALAATTNYGREVHSA